MNQKMPQFKDLYEFVLANKTDKTFLNYNDMEIAGLLIKGIQEGTLLYSLSLDNKISGMILASKNDDSKYLFVTENLAMNLKTLKEFAKIAKERWPDYTLRWKKHGIYKQPNTERVYSKLNL